MKLPNSFTYGRFKLESFYVSQFHDSKSAVIINGMNLIVIDSTTISASKVYNKLTSGEVIEVKLFEGSITKYYRVKILDKEWVEIKKM